jgi:hypothetical protein
MTGIEAFAALAPHLPRAGLEALVGHIDAGGDLLRLWTVVPGGVARREDGAAVACCCPLAFVGWKGAALATVGAVVEWVQALRWRSPEAVCAFTSAWDRGDVTEAQLRAAAAASLEARP